MIPKIGSIIILKIKTPLIGDGVLVEERKENEKITYLDRTTTLFFLCHICYWHEHRIYVESIINVRMGKMNKDETIRIMREALEKARHGISHQIKIGGLGLTVEPLIESLDLINKTLSQVSAPEVCGTCNGVGMVGGWEGNPPEQVGYTCEDCAGAPEAVKGRDFWIYNWGDEEDVEFWAVNTTDPAKNPFHDTSKKKMIHVREVL